MAFNSKKKNTNIVNGELLNGDFLPPELVNELEKLRRAYGARIKGLSSLLTYLQQFIFILSDDLKPGSKVYLNLHSDQNILQRKYLTDVKRNYRFLTYKILPYVIYASLFALVVVLISVGAWQVLFLLGFVVIFLSVGMIHIRATYFGKPFKYKLLFYQLPFFQLRWRLANGIHLQLTGQQKLVLITRIRKKFKAKRNRLTKTVHKNKASWIVTLRMDLPRAKYDMSSDDLAYLFRPGIPFMDGEITKVKTKSSSKKHTIVLQWPRVISNNGHTHFRFPEPNLDETLQLITKVVLAGLDKKSITQASHQAGIQQADDLTLIFGIGEGIRDLLHESQIYTFQQLADWSAEDLAHWLSQHKLKGTRGSKNWRQQAKELMRK